MSPRPPGTVYLVGAGPGDPDLITLRGVELLARADVIVYDGLANPVLLDHAPPGAEHVYAGKKHSERGGPLTQDEIEAVLVDRARRGLTVVRLKGGDPFVFGRGGEEAETLAAAGIPFEVVPGVTAATAVPAYAGIPLTHRAYAATAIALTIGHEGDVRQPHHVDWAAVAHADTIVLFMAVKHLAECTSELIAHGKPATTPAAAIRWGTTAMQETLVATLGTLAERAAATGLKPPALIVVGEVVRLRETISWYEKRPLFGQRVLVPRQKEQAKGFARAIVALGGEPYVCEVTELHEAEHAPLSHALAELHAGVYSWVAFTSANAVERTIDALLRAGLDVRAFARARLAAVGPATARALEQRGLRADLVPERGDGAAVAEAMLAADPALAARGMAVLLPRAAEGREELAQALTAAGARVDAVAAYRTVAVPNERLAPLAARLQAGDLHVLTFFSPSQVTAVLGALGAPADAARTLAAARLVAAIGQTTADALRSAGVRVDLVASAPSAETLAAEIVTALRSSHSPEAR
jgi:uroporphyrinogen III methyltransferase/synthase